MVTKENLEYTIDILGYTDDRAYSHVTGDINEILRTWPLPRGYSAALTGESADMGESMQDMLFLLGLAVIFVYLVLVPQFNSFIHPINNYGINTIGNNRYCTSPGYQWKICIDASPARILYYWLGQL